MQAIGYVLLENMITEGGHLKTPSFAEYLVPTALDTPENNVAEFWEEPHRNGPYGAKGMGEHALNTTAPAVLNAIFHATGVKPTVLPLLPETILVNQFR